MSLFSLSVYCQWRVRCTVWSDQRLTQQHQSLSASSKAKRGTHPVAAIAMISNRKTGGGGGQSVEGMEGGRFLKCVYQNGIFAQLPKLLCRLGEWRMIFRNLTAKVWANLDNPIKRYDFSKVSLYLCMSPSQVALF